MSFIPNMLCFTKQFGELTHYYLFINKNKMQSACSQQVAETATKQLLRSFEHALHTNRLVANIPAYNQGFCQKIGAEHVHLDNFPHPPIQNPFLPTLLEEKEALNLKLDEQSAFSVKNVELSDRQVSLIYKEQSPERLKRTASTRKQTAEKLRKKQKQQEPSQNISQYFMVPPPPAYMTEPKKIRQRQPTQEQMELEVELRAMQKKLYEVRRIKQQNEEKQRQKLAEIEAYRRKNRPALPKNGFTYSFQGRFMKKKSIQRQSFDTSQMEVNHSCEMKPVSKNQSHMDSESERGDSHMMSRYKKAATYNNFNKRQVSHLPFLKITENSVFREYGKANQGSKTQRLSLKKFVEKNEDQSFRHHHQIEKERRDRELAVILRNRQQQLEKQEEKDNPETQGLETEGSNVRRRQSYLLNRYYKKLKDQKSQSNRKSMNFSPASFPKNSAIHNFYRHNFDKQRSQYESRIVSKVFDN